MNYLQEIAHKVYLITNPDKPTRYCPEDEQALYLAYALLVLSKGTETTSEDVHDAWTLWATLTYHYHSSSIPFHHLPEHIQAYDDKYRDAIHKVARGA